MSENELYSQPAEDKLKMLADIKHNFLKLVCSGKEITGILLLGQLK